ncbi:MAG: tetratricopeptide repeat protein, partial [Deltaproteobacteria bacterium]|nr:tetratricopeptide repeat protein [Deltaproteobacteria bacterium]
VNVIVRKLGSPGVEELKLLGLLCRVRRKPQEAIVYYDRALAFCANDDGDPTRLFLQNERGQAFLEAGDTAQAIALLTETHAKAKQLPPPLRSKVTNNNLGAALGRAERFDEAIAFYEEKLQLFAQDPRLQSSILSQLAMTQSRAGRIADAIASFEAAWRQAKATGDLHNGKILLENLVALLQKCAAYSTALGFAKESLSLQSIGSSEHDIGRTLITLATLYLNLGLPDIAARHLIQAMRIVRRIRDYQLLGWVQINFGYLYKYRGRFMEALNAFEETLFLGEEHADEELKRWGRYGAADAHLDIGSLDEAAQLLGQLAPAMQATQDPEFRVRCEIVAQRLQVLKEATPSPEVVQGLADLAAHCAAGRWLELQWEVEHLLAIAYQKRREPEEVKRHLRLAVGIIQGLAEGLSEEFRESFRVLRPRARVVADLEAAEQDESLVLDATSASAMGKATSVTQAKSVPRGAATVVTTPPTPGGGYQPGKSLAASMKEIAEAAVEVQQGDRDAAAADLGIPRAQLDAILAS